MNKTRLLKNDKQIRKLQPTLPRADLLYICHALAHVWCFYQYLFHHGRLILQTHFETNAIVLRKNQQDIPKLKEESSN